MKIYAIYQNPSDYPNKFVLRVWTLNLSYNVLSSQSLTPDETPLVIADKIEECRKEIPKEYQLCPFVEVEPVIVETYLQYAV